MTKIRRYTAKEFRKNTREAFDTVEYGGRTFIDRRGVRYELVKASTPSLREQVADSKIKKSEANASVGGIESDEATKD